MGMRIHVGLSEKRGLPNFGSRGASCSAEIELDTGHVTDHPELFQQKVREAFAACRRAVMEQLGPASIKSPHDPATAALRSGSAHDNGQECTRLATAAQQRAIHALIGRRGISLRTVLQEHYGGRALEQLSAKEASGIIHRMQTHQTA